jgi:hypothetical protein
MTLITGSADDIAEILCGSRQHNAHCIGWRWHLYMQDQKKCAAAMREEARRMIAAARALQDARERFAEAAE